MPGGPGISWAQIVASTKDAPDKKSIFFTNQIGDYLSEMINDVDPCDGALAIIKDPKAVGEWAFKGDCGYWATSGSGLIRCTHCGNDSRKIGPASIAKLTSVGVTYGPTAATQIIYGYEPTKLGMVVSQDGGQTFDSFSNGLYKGQFVKQGSHIRASANGGTFFAAINDSLYVGRRHTGTIAISDITVSPPVIAFCQGQRTEAGRVIRAPLSAFHGVRVAGEASGELLGQVSDLMAAQSSPGLVVTARLSQAAGASTEPTTLPADQKPVWIALDASCLQTDASRILCITMLDARLNGNGWAQRGMSSVRTTCGTGEDIYCGACDFRMDRLWHGDGRSVYRPWPGPIAMTITAMSPDGSLSSAVAVASLYSRLETVTLWQPAECRYPDAEGDVCAFVCEPPPVQGNVPQAVASAPSGSKNALHISAKGKPWSLPLSIEPATANINGYYALAFWIKCEGKSSPELCIQLRDRSGDTSPITTAKVPLQKENLTEGGPITDTYRRVVVPLERLLKETAPDPDRSGSGSELALRRTMVKSLVLSGDGQSPQSYWIGDIVLYATAKEVEASKNPLQGGAK
jgi:hypothetical protein